MAWASSLRGVRAVSLEIATQELLAAIEGKLPDNLSL
jgi:hypothetical protein